MSKKNSKRSTSRPLQIESDRYEIANEIDNTLTLVDTTVNVTSHFMGPMAQVAGAAQIVGSFATFALFAPVISDVLRLSQEIVNLYQTAEHNKRICGVLLDRVNAAEASVRNLKTRKSEHADFFKNPENYSIFQKFKNTIEKTKRFIEDISQLKGLKKFTTGVLQANDIYRTFNELTKEFDGYVNSLQFTITIDLATQQLKDREMFDKDMDETKSYLRNIEGGITSLHGEISDVVEGIAALNLLFQKQQSKPPASDSQQLAIADVVSDEPLDLKAFSRVENTTGKVHKRMRLKDYADVAFKEVQLETLPENIHTQISILKKLKDSQNIVEFYGLAQEDGKMYLVTEWAEFGNLRSYYDKYGPLEWLKKIEFAVDICRGLSFLQAVSILHHDVRSENVLINGHHQAKLANFGLSRGFSEATRNIGANVNNVRYMAPEKLKKRDHRYDYKCEIYSFGMLLWEIAEGKIPYSSIQNDIIRIREIVCTQKYREQMKSDAPPDYKRIVHEATQADPSSRPAISDIFKVLFPLWKKAQPPPSPRPSFDHSRPQYELDNENLDELVIDIDLPAMTLSEAILEHRKENGDKEKAWKCFNQFKDLGDPVAKYWVGYYYYHDVLKWGNDEEKRNERFKNAAQLFKEAADEGNMSEAQLRYGHCLWRGEGSRKDVGTAITYFRLAADNGDAVAMYNIGNILFNGVGTRRDEVQGTRYLKLAAYHGHSKAAEMCKKKGIKL